MIQKSIFFLKKKFKRNRRTSFKRKRLEKHNPRETLFSQKKRQNAQNADASRISFIQTLHQLNKIKPNSKARVSHAPQTNQKKKKHFEIYLIC